MATDTQSPNGRAIRVLALEDRAADAELMLRELKHAGFAFEAVRVERRAEFVQKLQEDWDIILSDYNLPDITGPDVADLVRERKPDVPLIVVSGTVGDERAVECIKRGAYDYVLKDRLARLGPAVTKALEAARMRDEQRISRKLALLQATALETAADAIVITDVDGTIQWVNPAFTRMTGYSAAEAIGQNPRLLKSGQHDREFYRKLWDTVLSGDTWRGGFINRRKDGALYEDEHTITPVRTGGEEITHFIAIMHDMTEQHRSQARVRESEERFRAVVENINEVFWMTDVAKQRMLYISPGYDRIWGRPAAELYESAESWIAAIHEEDRERVVDAAKKRQTTGQYDETYRIVRPDGGIRWIHDQAYPIRESDGTVRRVVGVAEDITEQKKLEEQFLRAQRMEAIGTLAGGIAHDLNNILAPVLMVSGILNTKLIDPEDRKLLSIVEKAAERGAGIINQLLSFSKGHGGQRTSVQLRHLVKEIVSMARETFPRQVEIVAEIQEGLRTVSGNATQLHQMILNLCLNARDAMPDGGQLTLCGRNLELSADESSRHTDAHPGSYVLVAVSDTGTGIPAEIRDKIFDPFFTTKQPGQGTGLGLASVASIVKAHGGFVTVDSEPGRGTSFRICLPAEESAVTSTEHKKSDVPVGNGELILVVDDEPSICETVITTLERNGYRAIAAENGEKALLEFNLRSAEIRLVVTDMMMPEMGGLALIHALRNLAPRLPIIACSGLSHDEEMNRLGKANIGAFLPKPFDPRTLLGEVHRLLAYSDGEDGWKT